MRIRSVAAKPAPSLDLVPKKKHQILVDRDLADVIKRVAGALGYKSMSGLLNDALVCYLAAEYPHLELIFDEPEDEYEDDLLAAVVGPSESKETDRRGGTDRREKKRELPPGAERRTGQDRRKQARKR